MPTILLIRHGLNDFVGKRLAGRLPGVNLNEAGRKQAQVVAQALHELPITAVYSSPLERAVQTAEPIATDHNLEVQICSGLLEIDFGKWVGKTNKQMARTKLWKTVQEKPSEMRFPSGESFPEAQQRICREIDALAKAHDDKEIIVCVSHSDAIKLVVAHYLGMPLDNFQRINIDTTSITTLFLPREGGIPRFGMINHIVGLEFKRPPEPPQNKKPAEKEPKTR